jgi:hypothetical protein
VRDKFDLPGEPDDDLIAPELDGLGGDVGGAR